MKRYVTCFATVYTDGIYAFTPGGKSVKCCSYQVFFKVFLLIVVHVEQENCTPSVSKYKMF
jgi:hypothetical protein